MDQTKYKSIIKCDQCSFEKLSIIALMLVLILSACQQKSPEKVEGSFYLEQSADAIFIYQEGKDSPVLTQHTKQDHRPYLHPIMAPGTSSALTQFSPGHHKHQTGLYWGFTRINGSGAEPDTLKKWFYRKDKPANIQDQIGRDFFHNPGGDYWQKVSSDALIVEGDQLKWETVYHLLDDEAKG